jgi:hypothetical protein
MAVGGGVPGTPSPSPTPTPPPIFPVGATASADPPNAPWWAIFSLFLCFLGFLGVAGLLYGYKFLEFGAYYHGIPTRILFVLALALIGSPFYVTIVRRVPAIFLVAPITLLAFLYPLFSPYGLPYSRDPIYSFQFAQVLLQQHQWIPAVPGNGSLVTNQAVVYSFYPGSGVFNAETSSFTGLPLLQTFTWGLQLFRYLVIPLGIYALTVRFFGPRAGPLAVFLYMGAPSIEMNIPTQQDFAMPFLLLMVLMAVYIINTETAALTPLRVGFVVFSSFIIISHHLTSYLAGTWIAGIFLIPYLIRGRGAFDKLRPAVAAIQYLIVFLLFVLLVSGPAFVNHIRLLYTAVGSIFISHAPVGRAAAIGSTFPLYQTGWIFLSLALVLVISLYVLIRILFRPRLQFLSTLIIIALLTALITIPFLPTGFSFLALRLMEYSELILAPVVAWFLVVYLQRERVPPPEAAGASRARPARRRTWVPVAVAVVLSVVIFTGGALVPLSTRDAFAPASSVLIDAPRYINDSAYDAALWAKANLPPPVYNTTSHNWSRLMWGDYLVYSVYGGFGDFQMAWNPFHIFEHQSLSATNWTGMRVGDYVVIDSLMTHVIPTFVGPANQYPHPVAQPSEAVSSANLTKFPDNPTYFQSVFQNPTFTVYVVIVNPCSAPGALACLPIT